MAGHELAIKQREMADPKARNQPGECDLRGIGHPAEHRLAEEGPAQLHPVKAPDQFALMPAFDRMGMADGVQPQCRPFDHAVDPGLLPVRAGQQNLMKRLVASDRESARTDASGQRMRQMEGIQRDDRAAARLYPENVASVAAVGHGEDPGRIAAQQHPGIEPGHRSSRTSSCGRHRRTPFPVSTRGR